MEQKFRIGLIAGIAMAIGVMMIPGTNVVPAAFAHGHHGHHHHHHNHVSIDQHNSQLNVCDHSNCHNDASNHADVNTQHGSNDVRISQRNDQANFCSNSDCSNSASNDASVH